VIGSKFLLGKNQLFNSRLI